MAKILAVDDSTSMRQMISFTLKGAGHDVHEAADGQAGFNTAKSQGNFDLIITDVNMPGMDGIELIKALRATSEYKFTPILLLTTETASDKKDAGRQAGASGWIVKPFRPDQLQSTVNKVLG